MSDYPSLLESVGAVAKHVQALNRRAVQKYTPVVEDILRSRSCDTHHIEHTLDALLDFCGHEPALVLYRKLCRHYWELDPLGTASYVNAYREMWDSEELTAQMSTVSGRMRITAVGRPLLQVPQRLY